MKTTYSATKSDCLELAKELQKARLINKDAELQFMRMANNAAIPHNNLLAALQGFYKMESYKSLLKSGSELLACIKKIDNSFFNQIQSTYLAELKEKYAK